MDTQAAEATGLPSQAHEAVLTMEELQAPLLKFPACVTQHTTINTRRSADTAVYT